MKRGPRYLVIGGTTKAATTSLFFYLSDHPEICATNMKEVRFFMDPDYGLPAKCFFDGKNLEKYEKFYSHCEADKIRMDVTPDYLYSKDAASKIKVSLEAPKIVFILRNQCDRLVSWYKHAKQNNLVSRDATFEDFVMAQYRSKKDTKEQHMKSLEQGRYTDYLKAYYDEVGYDNVLVLFYEELVREPEEVVSRICRHAGIRSDFYREYTFGVFNRTKRMRFPALHKRYITFSRNMRYRYSENDAAMSILRRVKTNVERIYSRINVVAEADRVVVTSRVKALLGEYYRDENKRLRELLRVEDIPWVG